MALDLSTYTPEQRAHNMGQMILFATVLNLWANTELLVEMVIGQSLRLSTRESCIVCGPLGSGAKMNLVKALLAETQSKPDFVKALTDFQNIVGRNALAHGFATYEKMSDHWNIVWREVRDKLVVKSKSLGRYLDDDVMPGFDRVIAASGFTDRDMHKYGREVAALAQRL